MQLFIGHTHYTNCKQLQLYTLLNIKLQYKKKKKNRQARFFYMHIHCRYNILYYIIIQHITYFINL